MNRRNGNQVVHLKQNAEEAKKTGEKEKKEREKCMSTESSVLRSGGISL